MKIGILTLTLHTNYGGILQAYALQTVLERMGHEVEVLNRPFIPLKTKWAEIPKRIIKKLIGRDVVIFNERRYNREAPVLNKEVWEFRKKYIHERIINSLNEIKESDYDCIMVGSDQVWRPKYFITQWNTGVEDAFLAFTRGWKIKRVVYAASFGVDEWEYNESETKKLRQIVKEIDLISVREESGVSLLKKYLGTHGVAVLDPTMLLKKEDYLAIAMDAPKSKGNLLVYLLNPNSDKEKLVNKISESQGLIPFSTNDKMIKATSSVMQRTLPSVSSWLRGFIDAEYVITDSFHACVFSIIFGKPFLALGNEQRGMARFHSLFKKFNIEKNLIKDPSNIHIEMCKKRSIFISELLNEERAFSLNFLKRIEE